MEWTETIWQTTLPFTFIPAVIKDGQETAQEYMVASQRAVCFRVEKTEFVVDKERARHFYLLRLENT